MLFDTERDTRWPLPANGLSFSQKSRCNLRHSCCLQITSRTCFRKEATLGSVNTRPTVIKCICQSTVSWFRSTRWLCVSHFLAELLAFREANS